MVELLTHMANISPLPIKPVHSHSAFISMHAHLSLIGDWSNYKENITAQISLHYFSFHNTYSRWWWKKETMCSKGVCLNELISMQGRRIIFSCVYNEPMLQKFLYQCFFQCRGILCGYLNKMVTSYAPRKPGYVWHVPCCPAKAFWKSPHFPLGDPCTTPVWDYYLDTVFCICLFVLITFSCQKHLVRKRD